MENRWVFFHSLRWDRKTPTKGAKVTCWLLRQTSKHEQRRPEKPGHRRWKVEYGWQSVIRRGGTVIDEPQRPPPNRVRRRGMKVQTREDVYTQGLHTWKQIRCGAFTLSEPYMGFLVACLNQKKTLTKFNDVFFELSFVATHRLLQYTASAQCYKI